MGAQPLSSSEGPHLDLIRGYLERKGPPFADEFFFTKELTSKGKEYRLWHQDCFLGATRSEISNPGRYNLMFLIQQDIPSLSISEPLVCDENSRLGNPLFSMPFYQASVKSEGTFKKYIFQKKIYDWQL